MSIRKVWCVEHREGWCATKDGERPSEDALSDETLCGYVVTMRWGSDRGVPDCQDCRRAMGIGGEEP